MYRRLFALSALAGAMACGPAEDQPALDVSSSASALCVQLIAPTLDYFRFNAATRRIEWSVNPNGARPAYSELDLEGVWVGLKASSWPVAMSTFYWGGLGGTWPAESTGTVWTIRYGANGCSTQAESASLVVPEVMPELGLSASSFSFRAAEGGSSPPSQSLEITNLTAPTALPLAWSASTNQPWLSVSAGSGVAPSSVAILVSTSGLAAGTYAGQVTIDAPGAINAPQLVTVTLTIDPALGAIAVTPTSLRFRGTLGAANPSLQLLLASSTGPGPLSWTLSADQPWLRLPRPTAVERSTFFSVEADITDLALGTYTGHVTLAAVGATNTPVIIPVTLEVRSDPPPPPPFTVAPAALTFFATAGGQDPAPQFFTLSGTTPPWWIFAFSRNLTGPLAGTPPFWLSVGGASSNATTWSVRPDLTPAGQPPLGAGTYTVDISITDPDHADSAARLPVTLIVSP